MYHAIEFTAAVILDVATQPRHPLERVRVVPGTRMRVQVRPYVLETEDGITEVADLFLEDGSCAHAVPFACFAFRD